MNETIWIITHELPSDCPKARMAAEMDDMTKECYFEIPVCMHCWKRLKATKKAQS